MLSDKTIDTRKKLSTFILCIILCHIIIVFFFCCWAHKNVNSTRQRWLKGLYCAPTPGLIHLRWWPAVRGDGLGLLYRRRQALLQREVQWTQTCRLESVHLVGSLMLKIMLKSICFSLLAQGNLSWPTVIRLSPFLPDVSTAETVSTTPAPEWSVRTTVTSSEMQVRRWTSCYNTQHRWLFVDVAPFFKSKKIICVIISVFKLFIHESKLGRPKKTPSPKSPLMQHMFSIFGISSVPKGRRSDFKHYFLSTRAYYTAEN